MRALCRAFIAVTVLASVATTTLSAQATQETVRTGLDTTLAKAKAVEAGITGIVIMSFAGREREVTTTVNVQPMYQSSMYYQQPWGAWYGGWYNPYPMETINVNTVVTVQTRVYSLRQNKLVWAGTSETLNPGSYADLINDLAHATAKELQSAGLLKKP